MLNLKTKVNSKPGSTVFKLMPGEVKMFSPYIDPNLNYLDRGSYWDIYLGSSKTSNMEAMPGWPGDGVGFDCDWLAGNQLVNQEHSQGHWGGCIGLAWDDRIHVEFAPVSLPISRNKFVINMSAKAGSNTSQTIVSSIEMDYQKPTGLQEFIASNGTKMPMRYPKIDAVPNYVTGLQLVDRCEKPIKEIKRAKAFALLSIQAKSTSGGRDVSNVDGRLATKPWAFAHATIGASTQKVLTEHPANFSHEIDLQLLPGSPDDWIDSDPQDRSNFISGHTGNNGTKFGIQYEIPLAPIQSLATLNGANPGGSSGHLPRFAQPIGNSWAHPLVSSDNKPAVKMFRGQFQIDTLDRSAETIKGLLWSWYLSHAREVFQRRTAALAPGIIWLKGYIPPIKLLTMKKQWGSCSPKGNIPFEPAFGKGTQGMHRLRYTARNMSSAGA